MRRAERRETVCGDKRRKTDRRGEQESQGEFKYRELKHEEKEIHCRKHAVLPMILMTVEIFHNAPFLLNTNMSYSQSL